MKRHESGHLSGGAGERILLVDDTPANLDVLSAALEPCGYEMLVASSGEVALQLAGRAKPDLILLDVLMPGIDGYETCRRLAADEATRHIPVLLISARDETEALVEGFAAGAVDYITKPFQPEEVRARVETHLKISRLTRELSSRATELETANRQLQQEVNRREQAEEALQVADEQLSMITDREASRWGVQGFVGRSPTIAAIVRDIRKLQDFGSVNVLITGESGTGKELVARAVHFGSSRAKGPFIPVNCVAIPETLAESTLFGHVRGAFTGASADRKGLFELAHGGTLFLDELGDMPLALQAKLLRVLEERRVTPVGATAARPINVRVVAATNADLPTKVAQGTFRQDLYFRLAQFTVHTPPLRERREDIALLATHFLRVFATEMGRQPPPLSDAALDVLRDYDFPGNVRELKNIVERALIQSGGRSVRPEHLHLTPMPKPQPMIVVKQPDHDLPENLQDAEVELIRQALSAAGGNVSQAAKRLGVNRSRIYRRLSAGA